jgi:hypothetical protein
VPIEVRPARPEITGYRLDNNLFWIEWSGGKAQVLGCPDLSLQDWQPLGEPVDSPARIPLTQPMQFFRLMKPGPVN